MVEIRGTRQECFEIRVWNRILRKFGSPEKETDIKNSYKIITFTLFNFKLDVFSGRIERQRRNFVTSPT